MTIQRNSRILARAQEVGRLLAREEGKTGRPVHRKET